MKLDLLQYALIIQNAFLIYALLVVISSKETMRVKVIGAWVGLAGINNIVYIVNTTWTF